jgi:zinc protease
MGRLPLSFRALLLLHCVLVTSLTGCQMREPVSIHANLFAEPYMLPNGMFVTLIPDSSSEVVAINMRYDVGSRDEAQAQSGVAHFVEHLTFEAKGNDKKKRREVLADACTGGFNGYTTWDSTSYVCSTNASNLPLALFAEARRLAYPLMGITDAALSPTLRVVENEWKQNYASTTLGLLPVFTALSLFPQGHPQRLLPIGNMDELEHLSLEHVSQFAASWYVPEKASLVIAGRFDHEAVLAYVSRLFSGVTARSKRTRLTPASSFALKESKRVTTFNGGNRRSVLVAWPWPGLRSPHYATGEVARTLVGSAISQQLNDDRLWVQVQEREGERDSILTVEVGVPSEVSLGTVEAKILDALDRSGARRESVIQARVQSMARLLFDLQSPEGKAAHTQKFLKHFDHVEGTQRMLREFQDVGEDEVLTLYNQMNDGHVTLMVEPKRGASLAGELAQ